MAEQANEKSAGSNPTRIELQRLTDTHGWVPTVDLAETANVYITPGSTVDPTAYSSDQIASLAHGDGGWWYDTRNRVIEEMIRRHAPSSRMWDVGSGAGSVSRYLLDHGVMSIPVEPSIHGAVEAASRGLTAISADLADLRLPTESIEAVGMFDVLEHLDSRSSMLGEIHRVLVPGGKVFLTVPAIPSLWSSADDSAGHKLRYTRRTLRRELTDAGFRVMQIGYFFALPVVPLFLIRAIPYKLGKRSLVSDAQLLQQDPGLPALLLTRVEMLLAGRTPVGSSLLAVAKKRR
jgi:ubiquinone/menaquinone biosynthesis C-methylase UbiE